MEILSEILKKLYGLSEDQANVLIYADDKKETLKDNVISEILALQEKKINEKKADATKQFENGYKKAQGETLGKLEKELKEKYEIDTELKGLELIEDIIKANTTAATKKAGQITEDDIKKHPIYLKLEKEYSKAQKEAEAKNELESKLKNFERKSKFDRIKEKALIEFKKLNPVLSEDPVKQANQQAMFLKEFDNFEDFEITEDGEIIAMLNGKRYENKLGNVVPFTEITKEIADKYFDYKKQETKGGAGNKTGESNYTNMSKEELRKQLYNVKDPAEYVKIQKQIQQLG